MYRYHRPPGRAPVRRFLLGVLTVGVAGYACLPTPQPVRRTPTPTAAPAAVQPTGTPTAAAPRATATPLTARPVPTVTLAAAPASLPPVSTPTPVPPPTPTATPATLVSDLYEATLTEELNAGLAGRPLAHTVFGPAVLRDLDVRLRHGQMQIDGTAEAGIVGMPVDVAATVRAEAGRALVDIQHATVGGFPIPDATRQYIASSIQHRVDQETVGRGEVVRSVVIEDGHMVVESSPASSGAPPGGNL